MKQVYSIHNNTFRQATGNIFFGGGGAGANGLHVSRGSGDRTEPTAKLWVNEKHESPKPQSGRWRGELQVRAVATWRIAAFIESRHGSFAAAAALGLWCLAFPQLRCGLGSGRRYRGCKRARVGRSAQAKDFVDFGN
jgi:hypothetical protein